jgi:hypothetical protein
MSLPKVPVSQLGPAFVLTDYPAGARAARRRKGRTPAARRRKGRAQM